MARPSESASLIMIIDVSYFELAYTVVGCWTIYNWQRLPKLYRNHLNHTQHNILARGLQAQDLSLFPCTSPPPKTLPLEPQ